MLEFNENTLASAIGSCAAYPGYKVIVATCNKRDAAMIISGISDIYIESGIPGICEVRSHRNKYDVRFYNGSSIQFMPLSHMPRTARCHELLYDKDLTNEELLRDVDQRCVIIYRCSQEELVDGKWIKTGGVVDEEPESENYDQDSEALEEFLKTFDVNP